MFIGFKIKYLKEVKSIGYGEMLMIHSKVKDKLVTGFSQYLNSRGSGTSRFAVVDGYSSIDSYFSALLIENSLEPSRNHKAKLDEIFSKFGTLFTTSGLTYTELKNYYNCWLKARYDNLVPTPKETLDFLMLSNRVLDVVGQEIARRHSLTLDELKESLFDEVLGNRVLSFDKYVDGIHEVWQQKAELAGEMGMGSKLGNKMVNPSNFSGIWALADDPITRDIIVQDQKLGEDVADFYLSFLKLVDHIQFERFKRGIDTNETTNFMFSLSLNYHGLTMDEIAEHFAEMIRKI